MRGIILAGGTGSRLYPCSKATNKHLLPVGRQPMVYYPIQKLVSAGIEEILIVTGTDHMGDMVSCLGSGKDFGCEFTYRVQDEPGGIAQALRLARGFVANESMCVILGDNIFQESLVDAIAYYSHQELSAMVCLSHVQDPTRFGVAFRRAGEVIKLVEKPDRRELGLAILEGMTCDAITGVYFYRPDVFSVIDTLKPSARNELEITDVNCYFHEHGQLLTTELLGWWTDAGTFESLEAANHFVHFQDPERGVK